MSKKGSKHQGNELKVPKQKDSSTTMSMIKQHTAQDETLSFSRKKTNNSEMKMRRRAEYYKNHGGFFLVPKTKRLDWNIVNEIESVLNPIRGKRRDFSNDSGKFANKIDHIGDIDLQQISTTKVPDFMYECNSF